MLKLIIFQDIKNYSWEGEVTFNLEDAIDKATSKSGSLRIGFGSWSGGSIIAQDTCFEISERPGSSMLSFDHQPSKLIDALNHDTLYTDLTSISYNFEVGPMGRGEVSLSTDITIRGDGRGGTYNGHLYFPPGTTTKDLYLQLNSGGDGVANLLRVGQMELRE